MSAKPRHAMLAAALLYLSVGYSALSFSAPAHADADVFRGRTMDLYRVAQRAYIWGYPLVRAAQIRHNATLPDDPFRTRPPTVAGAPINRFGHAQALATPETRYGVAPNNDTLYSLAWLDMNDGPFVLETPDFGSRYYTFQMGQADSSTDVALGQRTHGVRLPLVLIRAQGDRRPVPRGMILVEAHQRYLMIAGRILVDGAADLPAVHALQGQVRLRRLDDYRAGRDAVPPVSPQRALGAGAAVVGSTPPPAAFLEMLGNVLRDWRVPPGDRALVRSFAAIGLTPADGYRPDLLAPETRESIERGIAAGEAAVRQKTFTLGTRIDGWAINYGGPRFGRDHLLRAAVAMDQIYVLPAAEALYPNARSDARGQVLDGRRSYVLHFDADRLPPVDAFWSLTMYHARGLMVPNPVNRYSIGDRTPGIVRDADGGLTLIMQHDRPRQGASNWLPTPAEPFMVMMRLYRPSSTARSGAWSPPALVEQAAR